MSRPPVPQSAPRRGGFTLIEVMVATAVMLIMVVMIGALFRQASSSWDSGYATAEGGMAVRSVIGALTRDLATAIDGRIYGLDKPVKVDGSSVELICYKPAKASGGTYRREIHRIKYDGGPSVRRTDSVLIGNAWKPVGKPSTIYAGGTGANGAKCTFRAADPIDEYKLRSYERKAPAFKDSLAWEIPSVKVRVELTRTGSFSGLTVISHGPDGLPNDDEESDEPDDIIVK